MYLFVIFSSLFTSLLLSTAGKYIGRQAAIYISLLMIIVTAFFTLIILYEIALINNIVIINLCTLFIIHEINVNIGFLFDSLTSIMLFVVIIISTFVHLFTAGYMSHDPFIVRFYIYLGFFTFFMVLLITSDNFLQLFVG
jgi:NADH:ubiquinone oxidoreductase subunit 5 (subunit L)/multisubunit Na+/H+ antiporter MnhA subunit